MIRVRRAREVMLLLFSARKSPTDSDLARDRLRCGRSVRSSTEPSVPTIVKACEGVCMVTVDVVRR